MATTQLQSTAAVTSKTILIPSTITESQANPTETTPEKQTAKPTIVKTSSSTVPKTTTTKATATPETSKTTKTVTTKTTTNKITSTQGTPITKETTTQTSKTTFKPTEKPVPAPNWSSWSQCQPAHNCLDTVASETTCPTRKRNGISSSGKTIQETTNEGCNCEPCSFRFSARTDYDSDDSTCTHDPGINGGNGDCPCHWTQYRYCQQLSYGKCKNFRAECFLFLKMVAS